MPPNVPRPEAVLRGHAGEVQALDFDAAERFLVSGCAAACRSLPACTCQPFSSPLTPFTSGPLPLARDSLGEVRVWRLDDLRPAAVRRLHPLTGGILSLRLFRTAGRQLLGTQGRDGATHLWACNDEMALSE